MSEIEKLQRLRRTISRLKEFRSYEKGWDLGRGDLISKTAINNAIALVTSAFDRGVWKSSAFPSPSGSVLIAFLVSSSVDIEVSAEDDGTFDFRAEREGLEPIERNSVVFAEAASLVSLFGDERLSVTCLSGSSIVRSILMQSAVFTEAQHLSPHPTVDFPALILRAPSRPLEASAITLNTTTLVSQALQRSTGELIRFHRTAFSSLKGAKMTPAT